MSSGSNVRAGCVYVELFTKDGLLTSGLKAAEAKVKAFGNAITSIGSKFSLLGASMFSPLLGAAKSFADSGADLLLMSQRTGVSVEALSALSYAAGQTGVSAEALESGLGKMARTIQAAADGSQAAQGELAGLGVTLNELMDLAPDEQFKRLAEGIAGIANPTTRAARAMDVFGRGGRDLLPLLNQGAEGLQKFKDRAIELDLIKTTRSAQEAFKLKLAFEAAGNSIKGLYNAIGGTIAPAVTAAIGKIMPLIGNVRAFIKENRTLFVTLGAIGGALVGVGTGLLIVGGGIKIAAMAIGTASSMVSLLATAVGLVASPLGIIALTLGTGIYLWTQFSESGQRSLATLKGDFNETWGGMKDAIESGDWQLAFDIACAGINLIWQRLTADLKATWKIFEDFFSKASDKIASKMQVAGQNLQLLIDRASGLHGAMERQADDQQAFASATCAAVQQFRAQNGADAALPADLQRRVDMMRQNLGVAQGNSDRVNNLIQTPTDTIAPDRPRDALQEAKDRLKELTDAAKKKKWEHDWALAEDGGPASRVQDNLSAATGKLSTAGTFSAYGLGNMVLATRLPIYCPKSSTTRSPTASPKTSFHKPPLHASVTPPRRGATPAPAPHVFPDPHDTKGRPTLAGRPATFKRHDPAAQLHVHTAKRKNIWETWSYSSAGGSDTTSAGFFFPDGYRPGFLLGLTGTSF